MNDKGRIGVFQAQWPVQSQTLNCVVMFARAGYPVDLFLYRAPTYVDIEELSQLTNVRVHRLAIAGRAPDNINIKVNSKALKDYLLTLPYARFPTRCVDSWLRCLLEGNGVRELGALVSGNEKGLLPRWVLNQTFDWMAGRKYRCLVGMEKKGLIWAGAVAEQSLVPYIYYSLELYTKDHPASRRSIHARRTKRAEARYHKRSLATIVQDGERAEILLRDNGVQSRELFYVPVSLLGEPRRWRSSYIKQRFQLSEEQIVILQFGQICRERFSIQLARAAQKFPEHWSLLLHGWGPDTAIRKIRKIDACGRVLVSLDMLSAERLPELVASADIGLALYAPVPVNDRLTSLASEKVALYLQCGLPIVAFDYPGYRRLFERYRCGVTIGNLQQLGDAVDRILSSYDDLRSNAYRCFQECYEFSTQFQKVIERVDHL